MIFRQFCTSDEDISYLLADPVTRYAAIVDANSEAENDYIEVIRHLDLRLMYLIETHVHESHLSAAPLIRADSGAQLVAHSAADMPCVDLRVADGERVFMGEESISILETPGHSACSLSCLWRDRVFTGHTLLAGATGPCRRPDADPGCLFDSVRDPLYALPHDTLICPGRVMAQRRMSNIGEQIAANTELRAGTRREQFIKRKLLQATRNSRWREDRLAVNRRCEMIN